ncbi:hypothetical protein PPERSA_04185 [Pseudocohnilembus persalinus]|uniref:Transmembrane protein n=1 Tax=Pseudocohnilembus persalinus TaxID=266149 RepID=A0A0V0QNH5_PSEPJ|nr:hypothetical protein PPERSA_04185 [Pseudocohnilembus persalinus]|eukprot:KRX03633.1 hypothetical protein PPERSA_04185 [Pseudocohnilembus persalinus]
MHNFLFLKKNFEFQIPNDFDKNYRLAIITKQDDFKSDPDIFIHDTVSHPTIEDIFRKYPSNFCFTYGPDFCYIPNKYLIPGKTIYITVYMQFIPCNFNMVVRKVESPSIFKMNNLYLLNIQDDDSDQSEIGVQSFTIQMPLKDTNPKEDLFKVVAYHKRQNYGHQISSDYQNNELTLQWSMGSDPKTDNYAKMKHMYNIENGVVFQIDSSMDEWVYGEKYTFVVTSQERDGIYIKTFFQNSKEIVQLNIDEQVLDINKNEIPEILQRNQIKTYKINNFNHIYNETFVQKQQLTTIINMHLYFGKVDMFIDCYDNQKNFTNSQFQNKGTGQKVMIISNGQIEGNCENLYITCQASFQSSINLEIGFQPEDLSQITMLPIKNGVKEYGYLKQDELMSFVLDLNRDKKFNVTILLNALKGNTDIYVKKCVGNFDCTFTASQLDEQKFESDENTIAYSQMEGNDIINFEHSEKTCFKQKQISGPNCYYAIIVYNKNYNNLVNQDSQQVINKDLQFELLVQLDKSRRYISENQILLDKLWYAQNSTYIFDIGSFENIKNIDFIVSPISAIFAKTETEYSLQILVERDEEQNNLHKHASQLINGIVLNSKLTPNQQEAYFDFILTNSENSLVQFQLLEYFKNSQLLFAVKNLTIQNQNEFLNETKDYEIVNKRFFVDIDRGNVNKQDNPDPIGFLGYRIMVQRKNQQRLNETIYFRFLAQDFDKFTKVQPGYQKDIIIQKFSKHMDEEQNNYGNTILKYSQSQHYNLVERRNYFEFYGNIDRKQLEELCPKQIMDKCNVYFAFQSVQQNQIRANNYKLTYLMLGINKNNYSQDIQLILNKNLIVPVLSKSENQTKYVFYYDFQEQIDYDVVLDIQGEKISSNIDFIFKQNHKALKQELKQISNSKNEKNANNTQIDTHINMELTSMKINKECKQFFSSGNSCFLGIILTSEAKNKIMNVQLAKSILNIDNRENQFIKGNVNIRTYKYYQLHLDDHTDFVSFQLSMINNGDANIIVYYHQSDDTYRPKQIQGQALCKNAPAGFQCKSSENKYTSDEVKFEPGLPGYYIIAIYGKSAGENIYDLLWTQQKSFKFLKEGKTNQLYATSENYSKYIYQVEQQDELLDLIFFSDFDLASNLEVKISVCDNDIYDENGRNNENFCDESNLKEFGQFMIFENQNLQFDQEELCSLKQWKGNCYIVLQFQSHAKENIKFSLLLAEQSEGLSKVILNPGQYVYNTIYQNQTQEYQLIFYDQNRQLDHFLNVNPIRGEMNIQIEPQSIGVVPVLGKSGKYYAQLTSQDFSTLNNSEEKQQLNSVTIKISGCTETYGCSYGIGISVEGQTVKLQPGLLYSVVEVYPDPKNPQVYRKFEHELQNKISNFPIYLGEGSPQVSVYMKNKQGSTYKQKIEYSVILQTGHVTQLQLYSRESQQRITKLKLNNEDPDIYVINSQIEGTVLIDLQECSGGFTMQAGSQLVSDFKKQNQIILNVQPNKTYYVQVKTDTTSFEISENEEQIQMGTYSIRALFYDNLNNDQIPGNYFIAGNINLISLDSKQMTLQFTLPKVKNNSIQYDLSKIQAQIILTDGTKEQCKKAQQCQFNAFQKFQNIARRRNLEFTSDLQKAEKYIIDQQKYNQLNVQLQNLEIYKKAEKNQQNNEEQVYEYSIKLKDIANKIQLNKIDKIFATMTFIIPPFATKNFPVKNYYDIDVYYDILKIDLSQEIIKDHQSIKQDLNGNKSLFGSYYVQMLLYVILILFLAFLAYKVIRRFMAQKKLKKQSGILNLTNEQEPEHYQNSAEIQIE